MLREAPDAAVVLLFDRRLDGGTHTYCGHAAVKTEVESEQTRELQRFPRPNLGRQPDQWRASGQPSWSLAWLLPREAPSKMGFGVVDAVPMPTPTCPLDAIRALAELCLLHVHACAKSACCTCVSTVVS